MFLLALVCLLSIVFVFISFAIILSYNDEIKERKKKSLLLYNDACKLEESGCFLEASEKMLLASQTATDQSYSKSYYSKHVVLKSMEEKSKESYRLNVRQFSTNISIHILNNQIYHIESLKRGEGEKGKSSRNVSS